MSRTDPAILPLRRDRSGATTGWRCRSSRTPPCRARPPRGSARDRRRSPAGGSRRSRSAAPGRRTRSTACSTSPPRCERPVTLLANLATHHLWGSHPRADRAARLPARRGARRDRRPTGTSGTSSASFGRLSGPGGSLYGVADTYPSLGAGGVHLQPRERLAAAIDRRDMPAGGVLAVVDAAGRARGARAAPARSGWSRASGTTAPPPRPATVMLPRPRRQRWRPAARR